MQLIVGDKRVNVTMRAKDAMIVIIALKGEELHKSGLPSRYIEVRRVPPATCHLFGGRGQRTAATCHLPSRWWQRAECRSGYRACYLLWCVLNSIGHARNNNPVALGSIYPQISNGNKVP